MSNNGTIAAAGRRGGDSWSPPDGQTLWLASSESVEAEGVVADLSGNDRHAVLAGTAIYTAGTGFVFSGANGNYAQVVNPLFSGPQTVTAWARKTTDAATFVARSVCGVVDNGITIHGVGLLAYGDPVQWRGYLRTDAGYSAVAGPQIAPEAWTFLAFSWDGATARLYVDGADPVSVSRAGDITTSQDWRVGMNSGSAFGLDGEVEDVQQYSRALTADEIASIRTASPYRRG